MIEYLKNMLQNDSVISSARFINVAGFFTATGLMIHDTILRGLLDSTNFGMYLAYCAGVYGVSKGLDKIQGKDNAV